MTKLNNISQYTFKGIDNSELMASSTKLGSESY